MKWAVLVSGSGTILAAMIGEGLKPDLVLADRPCRAIEIALSAQVPCLIIDRRDYGYKIGSRWDRDTFTHELAQTLINQQIEFVAMAGFDTVLSAVFFDLFGSNILNTHPSLLPAFKGLYGSNVIQAVLDSGITETGCTIHVATAELDDDRYIMAQIRVPVLADDDVERLWERVKTEERKLYPRVVRDILVGKLQIPQVV